MTTSLSFQSPRLADHVRVCRVEDHMIFLDLVRNKYFGVAGPQLPALAALLGAAPTGVDKFQDSSNPLLHQSIKRLRDRNLLSVSHTGKAGLPFHKFVEPVTSLNAEEARQPPTVGLRQLFRLWRATLVAALWLRRLSLADIASRVAALKTSHPSPHADASADAMLAAVTTYAYLRPFALTSHDRCLNDSLTLVHFLATQGLSSQWVIGVRVHPFGAHSWVQSGGVVLNDLAERVRHFRPILVV